MTSNQPDKKQRAFFLFLLGTSYISTFGFGVFYFFAKIDVLVWLCLITFGVYIILGTLSYFTTNLVTLFRLSITTSVGAFFVVVWYTGGANSPAMAEFFIPSLLAFFYRPINDRYYFMGICLLAIISMWPLTSLGYTANLLPAKLEISHSVIVALFVFSIVAIYLFLFREALANKNRQLLQALSDQKSTAKKLIQSEKMASLGVMLAGVGHELNNPLNFIAGGIDGLSRQVKDSKEAEPFVEAVVEGVNRATSIVKSLSHFSRNTQAMDEQVNLHEVIENSLTMLQYRLKYKIEVVKNYTNRPVVIIGNEGKLHQAVINIIANAQEAIPDKGTIGIETKVSRNQIRLTISDTGMGISEENLSKIGDPFFTTKAVGEGTGLGLSITYEILNLHGAEINVTSDISVGTKFTILFKT